MVAALLGISPPTFVALSHYSVVWLDHMCYLKKKKKKRDLGLSIIMNLGTFIQLGIKSFGHVNYFCTLRASILIDVLFIKKILIDVFLFFYF